MNMKYFFLFCVSGAALSIMGCAQDKKKTVWTAEQLEALEDSIQRVQSYGLQAKIPDSVQPDGETGAVRTDQTTDDAADDAAVWVHPTDPEKSLLIGSNKRGGIVVFDLDGAERAFYPTGRINNLDVLYGFPLGNKRVDIVGCTNRSDQSVDLLAIDPETGVLTDVSAHALLVDTNQIKDIYGCCFYYRKKPYFFINGKNGCVQQFEMVAASGQKIDLKLVRTLRFNTQTEGMVADEVYGMLYIGEEDQGVWKTSAEPDRGDTRTLLPLSGIDNPAIAFDVEGITLYKKGDDGYLIVSAQGNFSYAVFERKGNNRYLGSFKILGNDRIDGVEETDGIDVCAAPLGRLYPEGLFIAQDGYNYDSDTLQKQNFKMVRWEKIQRLIQRFPVDK
jgi:3-phytase